MQAYVVFVKDVNCWQPSYSTASSPLRGFNPAKPDFKPSYGKYHATTTYFRFSAVETSALYGQSM